MLIFAKNHTINNVKNTSNTLNNSNKADIIIKKIKGEK